MERKILLKKLSVMTGLLWVPGELLAESLERTPKQTMGPFYPDKFPLDQDNDLVKMNDRKSLAMGEVVYLKGVIKDKQGQPIKHAKIEIWQCDEKGKYLHSGDYDEKVNDKNFQGFGRFETNAKGEYFFRTIKPVPYGQGRNQGYLRTPHIHYLVEANGKKQLVSQLYIKGHAMNEKDFLYNRIAKTKRHLIEAPFVAKKDSKIKEWLVDYDIIV